MRSDVERQKPLREEDIQHISNTAERGLASLLLTKDLLVWHEPNLFEARDHEGKIRGATLPDIVIFNPRQRRLTVIEVTTSRCDIKPKKERSEEIDPRDPKVRQRHVMKNAAPDVRFVVLYKTHLENIQRATGSILFERKKDTYNGVENDHAA